MKWFEGLRTWSIVITALVGGFVLAAVGKIDKDIIIYILGVVNGYVGAKAVMSGQTVKEEPPKS
jgi:hypothetical protein